MAHVAKRGSQRWMREHGRDPYVKKAKAVGYRSRAAYKLIEIVECERLLRRGQRVIDLGAAPGGWSQVAASSVGPRGKVIALDVVPMSPLADVHVLQGDFRHPDLRAMLRQVLGTGGADLILSDMAPKLGGIKAVDVPRSLSIARDVLDLAHQWLIPGGALLLKVFDGGEVHCFRRDVARNFASVRVRKPAASRTRSSELYVVAKGFGL